MSAFLQRFRARLRNRRFDDDLAEELRVHEQMKREDLAAGGMPVQEARAEARRQLGNATLMRENARGVWIAPWIQSVAQDARYAVRTLARQPLHTLVAVTVLVLAISMIASLFTAFKAISLAPWPATDPDRIVRIRVTTGPEEIGPSIDEYEFIRQHATTLRGVAAYTYGSGMLQAPGRAAVDSQGRLVSVNFLDVLGARMHLGAGFLPGDDKPGGRRVAIISYDLWRTYFAGDPTVVGQRVALNKTPFTIIGVLEPRVDGLDRPVRLWMPLSALPATSVVMAAGIEGPARAACCINLMARLANDVDRARARQEVQLLHERFMSAGKRKSGVVQVFGTAFAEFPGRGSVMPHLFAALALVLVIACANVGNMQLARGLARRREISIRMAIGAGRERVVRQLLVEGLVLAVAAGAASVAVAALVPAALLGAIGEAIPPTRAHRLIPDWQVVALTASICLVACLLFALAPALHATARTIPLSTVDRGSTRRERLHLRGGLLAVQIAVCTVLLIGAGLVSRALAHALTFDAGFQVAGVTRLAVSLPGDTPGEQQREFERRLLGELEQGSAKPIAVSTPGPVAPTRFFTMHVVLAQENATGYRTVERRSVSRDYFEVLGIPVVKGRVFASTAVGEILVNETFARVYGPAADVGRTIREVDRRGAMVGAHTIVGITRDAYLTGLERIEAVVFTPTTSGTLVTRGGPAHIETIRATAAGLNASSSVRAWPLSDDLKSTLQEGRAGAAVAWAIGLIGLLLASVGVLGVFSYAVEERRREIGVRLALGAARRQIVAMLVSSSGRAMLLGLGAGILLSFACGPLLRAYLYGLSPVDPVAYGMVTTLLAAAGILATLIPARRACRVDPAITLRED